MTARRPRAPAGWIWTNKGGQPHLVEKRQPTRGARHVCALIPEHERRNSNAYVVAEDLAAIPEALQRGQLDRTAPWGGLVKRNFGELNQWRLRDELGPVALAIVAVLSLYRGLKAVDFRRSLVGCGVQAPVWAWVKLLGCSERQFQYALVELQRRHFIQRRRRLVKVDWVDSQGIERRRADIHAVIYLTDYGARRIERRGESRRLVVQNGHERRLLMAAGVVGNLLVSLKENLRLIARRLTEPASDCTPSSLPTHQRPHLNRKGTSPPGKAEKLSGADPPQGIRAQAARRPVWHSPAAWMEGELLRVRSQWSAGGMTVRDAWPASYACADSRGKRWLERQWTDLVRRLTRRTLLEQLAGAAR